MQVDNIIGTALEFFGAISIISGGVGGIVYILTPVRKLKKRVDAIESKLEKDYDRMDVIENKINDVDETAKQTCKAILQLMNHEITGNNVDKLKESKEKLEEFLIEK